MLVRVVQNTTSSLGISGFRFHFRWSKYISFVLTALMMLMFQHCMFCIQWQNRTGCCVLSTSIPLKLISMNTIWKCTAARIACPNRSHVKRNQFNMTAALLCCAQYARVCFLYRSHLLHVVNRHYFKRQKINKHFTHRHAHLFSLCWLMRANVCSTAESSTCDVAWNNILTALCTSVYMTAKRVSIRKSFLSRDFSIPWSTRVCLCVYVVLSPNFLWWIFFSC